MKKIVGFLLFILISLLVFVACDDGSGKTLGSVTDINYDGTTITWKAVDNAEKYTVSINGEEGISAPVPMFTYGNSSGSAFTVSIVAKAEGCKDSTPTTITFSPLDMVTNIQISDDGTISYNPVDGAAYYLINVDGVDHIEAGLTYDKLTAGTHVIKISAKADSENGKTIYYSKYSDPRSVTICGEVDKNKIKYDSITCMLSWSGVSHAQSYEISIQSNSGVLKETVNKTSYEFEPHNSNFTVSIRALGNHSSSYDSKIATEKNFIYLETAKNIRVVDGILLWDSVEGADGYNLRLNNNSIITIYENQYTELPVNASVDVEIMPISNEDAYFTSWSVRETYKILPAPVLQWVGNHDGFDGDVKESIFWDSVENSNGYMVSLSFMAPGDREPSIPETYSLSDLTVSFGHDFLETGTYFIRVKSLADDADPNTSDSKYSQEIRVIRLASPTLLSKNGVVSNADNLQDGVTVSFNSVARATEYRVWKEGNIYQLVSGGQFKDYNVVTSDVIVEQIVAYRVQSVGKNVSMENGISTVVLDSLSNNMMNVSIKVLASPKVKTMTGYVYSYDTVQGAYGYNVSVNGQNNGRDNNLIDLSFLTSGTYDVKVCARGNGADVLASNYSSVLQIYRLMSPYDIRVLTDNINEGMLSFGSDPNHSGSGFELYIDGSETAIPVDSLTNVKQYITTTGTEIFMRATANHYNELNTIYYMTSPASETLHIRKLSPVSFGDHAFTNSQFIWNTSSGAIRYEVYNAQEILYGSYDGASMQLDSIVGGRDYVFMVKAIGDGITTFNSDFSDQKTIYKLNTPKLYIDGDCYKWNAVADATSYVFYIDGQIVSLDIHVSGDEYYVIPNFTELKTYNVQVKAVGDGGVRTIDSAIYSILQETKQLSTPDFTIGYSKESFSPDGEIIVNITKQTPYANGYAYIIGGVVKTINATSFRYNPNSPGSYEVGVYAIGGIFDEAGIYYLSSQTCGNNSSYTIKLLGKPDASSIKLSMDGRISWQAVEGATSYTMKLIINGKKYDAITVYSPAYDLSALIAFKNVQSLEIEIQAHGNSKCVTSATVSKDWPAVTH